MTTRRRSIGGSDRTSATYEPARLEVQLRSRSDRAVDPPPASGGPERLPFIYQPPEPDEVLLTEPVGVFAGAEALGVMVTADARERRFAFVRAETEVVDFASADFLPQVVESAFDVETRTYRMTRERRPEHELCSLLLVAPDASWEVQFGPGDLETEIVFPPVPDGYADPVPDWSNVYINCRRYPGWTLSEGPPNVDFDGITTDHLVPPLN